MRGYVVDGQPFLRSWAKLKTLLLGWSVVGAWALCFPLVEIATHFKEMVDIYCCVRDEED